MILKDILDELRFGELSGANLGENALDGISPFNYERLTNYINAGLNSIYTRLPLRYREVLIEQNDLITIYHLHSKFAKSNTASTEPVKYLIDTGDKFDDSVLRILEIYNAAGILLPINDNYDNSSVFTVSNTAIQIPFPVTGNILSVIYQSTHKRVEFIDNETQFLNQEIDLTLAYAPALINFVLYKYHSSVDTPDNSALAIKYASLFEQQINQLNQLGMAIQDNSTNNKLELNGWV